MTRKSYKKENLFETYMEKIKVMEIGFDWESDERFSIGFWPAYVRILIPKEMAKDFRVRNGASESSYSAMDFASKTNIIGKIWSIGMKVREKHGNSADCVLSHIFKNPYFASLRETQYEGMLELKVEEMGGDAYTS